MSMFSFKLQKPRRFRFYASASLAALIASVLVGAMEIYASAATNAAVVRSQPATAPSLAGVVEQCQGVPRLD